MMGKVWKIAVFIAAFAITSRFLFPSEKFDPRVVSGKRVLITGASTGIGEQLAYQYAQNGASVFITARREQLLEKVIQKCKQIGAKDATFGFLAADMADMKQIEKLVTSSVDHLGGLDVVVINHALLLDVENEADLGQAMKTLRKCLQINTEAPAYVAGLTLPYLRKSKGNLGVVNSIGGKVQLEYGRAYGSSKFALDAYFSSLYYELRGSNVSVTNVVLGAIETDKAREILDKAVDKKLFRKEIIQFVSPEDTAKFILEGVAKREKEIYYPPHINYVTFFREILMRYDILAYLTE